MIRFLFLTFLAGVILAVRGRRLLKRELNPRLRIAKKRAPGADARP